MPFALFGALVAIWLRGLNNDVYFQIGLVTLIGLASKNAILIVEFAVLKRREGLSAVEAATEAAKLRFRPIIMTSLAFILGVRSARDLKRGRCRQPPFDRYRRDWRHGRGDLHRRILHTAVLPADLGQGGEATH